MRRKYSLDTGPWFFFALGCVSGSAAFLAAFAFSMSYLGIDALRDLTLSLKDWQTLIGSLLALAAAIFTIFILQEQISVQQANAADFLDREQFAAKTALPAALVGLSEYCEDCLASLRSLAPHVDRSTGILRLPAGFKSPKIPPIPPQSVRLLEAALKSGTAENREAIAWVLRRLQIIDSRLRDLDNWIRPGSGKIFARMSWISYLIDVLEFRTRMSQVFPYARGEVDDISSVCTTADLITSAFFADLNDHDIPGFEYELRRRGNAAAER